MTGQANERATSLAMLEKHYGSFIRRPDAGDLLDFLGGLDGAPVERRKRA